ncbi:MAG: DUF692 domain-containing protein [Pseudobacteriovorax sp.]|nr:DUF692 domain-containing protein [Pseudobacteriovorax sp.]
MKKGFHDLGIGAGLRHPHFRDIMETAPNIPWFEALTENYLATEGYPKDCLMEIADRYPIALHGVSMSVGSHDSLDLNYIKKLKKMIGEIHPVAVSDHLCWTGVIGINTHDLLPMPYTDEALIHCIRRVRQIQDELGVQILLENPSSYLAFKGSVWEEAAFLNTLAIESGCGILLDINNVYVSSKNFGFDPKSYLKHISPDLVGYMHIAGHSHREGYILDSHVGPIPSEVLKLYHETIKTIGPRPTIVEWDEDIPELSVLMKEIENVKRTIPTGKATADSERMRDESF